MPVVARVIGVALLDLVWLNAWAMAFTCDFCGKGYMKGNLVPRGIGRRVTRRTLSRQKPNLRNKRIEINGVQKRVRICTGCLSKLKKSLVKEAPQS